MIVIYRFFMILAWFLVGPINTQALHGGPAVILSALTLIALGIAVVARRSSRDRSIALLSVFAIMFYQSLELIAVGLHNEVLHSGILESEGIRSFFSFFFDLNLGLAITGAFAALVVSLFLAFGKSRLPLTNMFPEMRFVKAPSQVVKIVSRLAWGAGVSPPKVSLIDSGDLTAFITRSKQGFVLAVSVGLLESLSAEELEACLAHELSHLKNKDFVLRSLATMAKVGLFSHPLSHIIEPAVYRARELLADKTAAELIGGPGPLVSALSKISESQNYFTRGRPVKRSDDVEQR